MSGGDNLSLGEDFFAPRESSEQARAPEPASGSGLVLESPVFRVQVPELWVAQPLPPQAPRGDAALNHTVFGFSLFQTVVAPPPGAPANTQDAVKRAMLARLDQLSANGHQLTPGRMAFTGKPFGPVGICDVVLDERRYGVMVGYGFPEVVLIHFMDGDVGQEPAVQKAVQALLDGVSYSGGGTA